MRAARHPAFSGAPSSRRRFITGALALGAAPWLRAQLPAVANTPDASLVIGWNREVLDAVMASATSPCLTSRALAIVHSAGHDAFNSQLGKACLLKPEGGLSQPAAPAAAAMAVASSVAAIALFPSRRPVMEELLKKQLALFPPEIHTPAMASGQAWAAAHLDDRAGDGASRNVTYVPRNEIGIWRRTPARMRPPELPQWPQVRPFALASGSQFRPGPPPPLNSPEYAQSWIRVRDFGGLKKHQRTPEETEIARFWSCFSYTVTPAGHWSVILGTTATDRKMPLPEAVRAFAVMGIATADAAIAAWDVKYVFESWRPVHAIPMADKDGNPATEPVPGWTPLLETPPHPDYVSGHSVMGQAGAEVLRSVWGRDDIAFDTHSDTVKGVTRPFTSIQAGADEMGVSRVFGGIHFPFATDTGLTLGRSVGRRVIEWMNERVPV